MLGSAGTSFFTNSDVFFIRRTPNISYGNSVFRFPVSVLPTSSFVVADSVSALSLINYPEKKSIIAEIALYYIERILQLLY